MKNNRERYFKIAGHNVVIKGSMEEDIVVPSGFEPFEMDLPEKELPLFTLGTGVSLSSNGLPAQYTFQFEELDLTCEFACSENDFEFRMFPNAIVSLLMQRESLPADSLRKSTILVKMPRRGMYFSTNVEVRTQTIHEFRFLLWIAYGIAAASFETVAIHSSVIVCKGRAVLFLGESGTGKSTHTQLWLKNIPDCKLLNDDSPIVRILEEAPICFGSPWSGKINCYLNESYPIAAIVRLRQAPFNRIERLNKIEAFTALYPSCPPSFSADSELIDHICHTLSTIIRMVPVYHLNCLPDANAVFLACSTIFGYNDTSYRNGHE